MHVHSTSIKELFGYTFISESLSDSEEISAKALTLSPALESAIKNPGEINKNMVDAQQARRLLDRIIGWKLSPILWKALKGKVSAGRVQSAGLKIIKEKESEINNSISSPYFKITGGFTFGEGKRIFN